MHRLLFATCCCQEEHGDSFGGTDLGIEHVGVFSGNCVANETEGESVAYVGDVEGRWETFCEFVDNTAGLKFMTVMDHEKRRQQKDLDLELEDGWQLVFGGDASIQGTGSLRILDTMIRVKRQWPERVHLLLGMEDLDISNWVMDFTGLFETRRGELAHIRAAGAGAQSISNKDVSKSFEDSLKPGGHVSEYLRMVQLGVKIGDTVFAYSEVFADGHSLDDIKSGPRHKIAVRLGMAPPDDPADNVKAWLTKANKFARTKVRGWKYKANFIVRQEKDAEGNNDKN